MNETIELLNDLVGLSRKDLDYKAKELGVEYKKVKRIPLINDIINDECIVYKGNRKCCCLGCIKRPIYNLPGETKPLCCSNHKKYKMVDVINKRCIHNDCIKHSIYNLPGETKPLYCSNHKKDKMVNVISKRCIYKDCDKQPNYNLPSETKALYCSTHKKDKMVNVKHKRCLHEDCDKQPIYNLPGETKGLYCSNHKKHKMVDVINKRCIQCQLNYQYKKIKTDLCYTCYIHKYPDSKIAKKDKVKKQEYFFNILKKDYKDFEWDSFDKTIEGTCNNRRPDCFKDCGTHILIGEFDENQHKNYNPQCEKNRLNELYTGFADRPMVIIRLNPDKYVANGNKYESCFSLTEKIGKLKCDKKMLKKRVKDFMDNVYKYSIVDNIDITKPVTTIPLFFDE